MTTVGRFGFATIVLAMALCVALLGATPAGAHTMWKNGRWFDGSKFVARTMYSTEGGLLSTTRPRKITQTVDLNGGFVVPAYGDAHHHGIDGAPGLDEKIAAFLRDGIFYVKNPNVIPDLLTSEVRSKINHPRSIDVAFANGGITGTGGHPGPLHHRLAANGVFPGLTPEHMPERAYFNIDSIEALDSSWPKIIAGKPDFIKVFLNGRARIREGDEAGTKVGVSPQVLEALIARAHSAGLRVTAHVDTAEDFTIAVRAGVDELGHMPAYDPTGRSGPDLFLITDDSAAEAARRKVTVVPTASVSQRLGGKRWTEKQRAAALDVHRRNLAVLKKHEVSLAAGSDGISGEAPLVTAKSEIEFLGDLGTMTNLELLGMWAVDTPRTIFPNRKIGHLRSGYEANFLVLEADPLTDARNLHKIRLRVKLGHVL